jgi:hypothetical protein
MGPTARELAGMALFLLLLAGLVLLFVAAAIPPAVS